MTKPIVASEFDFEEFSEDELKHIVDGYFAGPSSLKVLEEKYPHLAVYAMDGSFCHSALLYLIA